MNTTQPETVVATKATKELSSNAKFWITTGSYLIVGAAGIAATVLTSIHIAKTTNALTENFQ